MPTYGQSRPDMRERITIQRKDAPTLTVSLSLIGTTATATTTEDHGFVATDYVTVAGADSGWNGKWKVLTVPTTKTFTFTVIGTLTTPSTGTVVYTSNATGGKGTNAWRTLASIRAARIPLKAWEHLQLQSIQSETTYRFQIRARADIAETMRILWQPSWPPGSSTQTLEINGILPDPESVAYQFLEASQVPA